MKIYLRVAYLLKGLKIIVAIIFFSISSISYTQGPEVYWEQLYCDGSYFEFAKTPDGGIVFASATPHGIICEKAEVGNGLYDYWIVKMDSNFNIQWQKIIGGSGDDQPTSINLTSDGGYIVGGTSNSPISGDKTEPPQDLTPPYSNDIWILKLDASGNIEWQNTIGGNATESKPYIEQIDGGGYILGARSNSGISGDKMEETVGGGSFYDYWIMKLNSTGNIVWQHTIGGNSHDYFTKVHQTYDGGFIVSGHSNSDISGDKTHSFTGDNVNYDLWILKLTPGGSIQWQKTIGAYYDDFSVDVIPMPDGGYIVGSSSENYYQQGNYQIIKLKSNGGFKWTSIIGCGGDYLNSISLTSDGGFLLGGRSNSYTCEDKSDSGPPNTHGWDGMNMWVVKTDSLGNREWDNALGGSGDDGSPIVSELSDGIYLLGGYAGDDEGEWDKSNPWSGLWLAKLKDSVCLPTTELCNGLDDDCNGVIDDEVVESISVSADGPLSFCQGSSVLLTVESHTGTSLQWKKNGEDIPGATNSTYNANAKGTYTCQTTSACSFAISEWMVVNVYKKPNAIISADGPTNFCEGGSVILTATLGGGQAYQWYKDGIPVTGATGNSYIATSAGDYRCLVTKIGTGCNKQSNNIIVSIPCKQGDATLNDFIYFPNPAKDKISIIIDKELSNAEIIISDISGVEILRKTFNGSTTELNIATIAAGMYFIRMQYDDQKITKIFIKE